MPNPGMLLKAAISAQRRLPELAWFVMLYLAGIGGLSLLALLLKALLAGL